MHPEVKSEISKCDKALKDLQKQLKNKEDEVLAIQVIKDRTKSNFFTVVRPQLLQIDPVKYSNRAELDKDLRLLAIHCSHKVPPEGKDLEAMIATAKARRRKSAPEMNSIILTLHLILAHIEMTEATDQMLVTGATGEVIEGQSKDRYVIQIQEQYSGRRLPKISMETW